MEDEGLVRDTEMERDVEMEEYPGIEEDAKYDEMEEDQKNDEMEDESSVRDAEDKVDTGNSNRKTVNKGFFLLPSARNSPAINLIRIPPTKEYAELFQITLATRHEITSKIDDITSALRLHWGINQFRIVFVVPQKLTDKYPLQRYKGTVKSRGDITQWVLGIKVGGRRGIA